MSVLRFAWSMMLSYHFIEPNHRMRAGFRFPPDCPFVWASVILVRTYLAKNLLSDKNWWSVWCGIGSYRSSGSEREAHRQEMVGSNSITVIKVKQQGLGNGKDDKVVAALANKARLYRKWIICDYRLSLFSFSLHLSHHTRRQARSDLRSENLWGQLLSSYSV